MSLKILLSSNAPWVASGYGSACNYLVQIFQKLNHKVAVLGYFGMEGGVMKWQPPGGEVIDIYSRGNDQFGNDVAEAHMHKFGGDVLISLVNVHVLRNFGSRTFPWVPIIPIEEEPLTEGNRVALQGMVRAIAISKFGQNVLRESGIPSSFIYLPVPTSFYSPIDKRQMKSALGWPEDAYIVGHIGMNRGIRKGHDALLQAFRLFLGEVPNALLYLHSDTMQHDGLDLARLVRYLGIQEKVIFPQRYDAFFGKSAYWMNGLYNALDLYVQPSHNEGQGMPVWEAMSCGVPVIASATTALKEITELDGDILPIDTFIKYWQPNGAWGYDIDPQAICDQMLKSYEQWGMGYTSIANRQLAIENVGLDTVGQQWQDELLTIEKIVRFTPVERPWKKKPTVTQVSSIARNCGIAAYTRMLMASMSEHTEQNLIDIRILENAKQIPNTDIVHFHYEPNLVHSHEFLHDAMRIIKLRGSKIACTYHSVSPDIINYHLSKNIVDAAIIHWPHPIMSIDDKRVTILGGMGCPVFQAPAIEQREEMREQYGFHRFDTIISTFGFASVGRGHFEILEHLAPYMMQDPALKLQLILPANFLNEEGKNNIHKSIIDISRQYNLQKQIQLVADFISDLQVLERLFISQVGFLYLGMNTYSSSSAIRFFISARLPTVINSSTHFDDVKRGVIRVEGFNTIDVANEIMNLLKDTRKSHLLRIEHEATYKAFMWPVFAEKALAVYKSLMIRS